MGETSRQLPSTQVRRGLYDPRFEHDACGIGFVAQLSGERSHRILQMALTALANVAHRGGVSADGLSGDGAGVLTQIPRAFFERELAHLNLRYPVAELAVGMVFLPQEPEQQAATRAIIEESLAEHGLTTLRWRTVPVDLSALGGRARESCPAIEQVLVDCTPQWCYGQDAVERALYIARKTMEARAAREGIERFSIPSLSSRTIVYKGLLVAPLLGQFYPDLRDPLFSVALAVYHQRYSTNTAPTWERAQPFRMLSHNGEINTLGGNIAWMRAREAAWRREAAELTNYKLRITSEAATRNSKIQDEGRDTQNSSQPVAYGPALARQVAGIGPVIDESGSDSTMLDNALELAVLGGRDIRQAISMLVPEAWENVPGIEPELRAFYAYHSCLTEPWDGPAALAFSDGQIVGLALDRNGLRPARYLLTDDGLVLCGSETGVVPLDDATILRKGKLGPGQMIAVDLRSGEFLENEAIKASLAAANPYADWLRTTVVSSPAAQPHHLSEDNRDRVEATELQALQHAFGYTSEELTAVLRPMLEDGQEPTGSMGDDTPPAFLSEKSRPLYAYFKQRFAQVTNPPIDPLREQIVMSLDVYLGYKGDLLSQEPGAAKLLRLESPILTDQQLADIVSSADPALRTASLPALFEVGNGRSGLRHALRSLCGAAEEAVCAGARIVVLTDRGVSASHGPIPALLAVGVVHNRLIRAGLRRRVGLVVESGEPREVHHLACLVGMGAEAVNPYLALASVRHIAHEREKMQQARASAPSTEADIVSPEAAEYNYVRALKKGLLKVMSKMGISTLTGYCGAQLFEALGLADEVIGDCFEGLVARLGGVGYEELAAHIMEQHARAFPGGPAVPLPNPGFYKYKKDGEYHTYSPSVVHALQNAVKGDGDYEAYRTYSDLVNRRPPAELRDLLDFVAAEPVPVDEVEVVESIVTRFSTAAMSHGSTSSEAHETLAIAMNRLGGLSNSGEGGEDPARFGDERNSPIKQVASARFGVTPAYLVSARELQIKMAQGSKPGEGGQLPGHKVTSEIARIRHATPGIELISPPPHHDIYSIEDLAQLIYDLKQVKPGVDVSVKLVAEAGVGTVAAGVAKAGADIILISGHSGGTGASPLSSIKNAGVNWELGLAEAQQTLVMNGLRGRVRLRADGGLKTGRDVVIAAMLGADEFSFGTAALVAEGCLMARTCHSNNCPVGIATQRPELRAKFAGTPEGVMHFFLHLARDVREIVASLGARSLAELTGRCDLLHQVQRGYPEADLFDLSALLARVDRPGEAIRYTGRELPSAGSPTLNERLLEECAEAIEQGRATVVRHSITNRDRTVGAMLAGRIAARHKDAGLPEGTVTAHFQGSAGQSFGAFLVPGMHLHLEGDANDYVGKAMAGGEIAVYPPRGARYPSHRNVLLGNTVLYGATGGALYAAGRAGERFAVRNSGAVAVVEGVGDHGCEYMTGGVVLVLGRAGRNFAAGMSGGLAYVLDEDGTFSQRCNGDSVRVTGLATEDEEIVLMLLLHHLQLTGSRRADELLLGWGSTRQSMRHVRPLGQVTALPQSLLPQSLRVREHYVSGEEAAA